MVVIGLLIAVVSGARTIHAQEAATLTISIENNRFVPAELAAPADRPLAIRVKNLGASAIEFESVSLRVEKIVGAKSEVVVNVRALRPGRYEFFDDFHRQSRGALVVK